MFLLIFNKVYNSNCLGNKFVQSAVSKKLWLQFYSMGIIVIHRVYLHPCRKLKGQVQPNFQILELFVGVRGSSAAFAIQLVLLFVLLFPGGKCKTRVPRLWSLVCREAGCAVQPRERTWGWKCSIGCWFHHWNSQNRRGMLLEESF